MLKQVRPAGGGIFAQNKRTFAAIDVGYPDGFRVDTNGYVYTSAGDGVQVFSPGMVPVGLLP